MKKTILLFITVFAMQFSFAQTKHVLFEEVTGTWCQWCTGGTYYADSLAASNSKIITIAVHGNDPMEHPTYATSTGLTSYPSANIDRGNQAASLGTWFSESNSALGTAANADIDVFTSYNPTTRVLTARVKATFANAVSGNYRLAAIVVEDGVTGPAPQYDQSNSYSGGGNGPMGGFEQLSSPVSANMIAFNHVARELLGGYNGQAGSVPASVNAGDTASHTFTHTLPADWNPDFIHVVGLLLDPSSKVDNCNESAYLDGNTNAKPIFISSPNTSAYVNSPYQFDVYANDADNKNITITATTLPSWLSMSAQSTLGFIHSKVSLTGTPTATGTFPVELIVSDGSRSDTLAYTLTVHAASAGNWQLAGNQGFATADFTMGAEVTSNGDVLVYMEGNNTCNVYKQSGSGNWSNYGNLNGSGYHGRMALSSDGVTPWVAYSDGSSLNVKKYDNGSWVQVGTFPTAGVQIGFDLNANDQPYVALQDGGANYSGNCYTYDGSSWSKVGGVAYSGSSPGVWNDLKVDRSNGHVYVLWNDFSNGRVSYVSKWDGSSWTKLGNAPISVDEVMFSQSIDIHPISMEPYVAFARANGGAEALDVVRFSNGSWSVVGSDVAGGAIEDVSMCFNNAGVAMVAFNDITNSSNISAKMYAYGNWSSIGVPGFSLTPGKNPIITSYNNMPYVFYAESSNDMATVRYYDMPVAISQASPLHTGHFDVYPNPTKDLIYIEGISPDVHIEIYDMSGRMMWEGKAEEAKVLSTENLENGTYIIRAGTSVQKFMVTR